MARYTRRGFRHHADQYRQFERVSRSRYRLSEACRIFAISPTDMGRGEVRRALIAGNARTLDHVRNLRTERPTYSARQGARTWGVALPHEQELLRLLFGPTIKRDRLDRRAILGRKILVIASHQNAFLH